MLTPDEVKKVRENAISLLGDAGLPISRAVLIRVVEKLPRATALSNGYHIILTVDKLRRDIRYLHLSVKNSVGETDPADSEAIAKDVLGEKYASLGNNLRKDVFHFFKLEVIKDDDRENKNDRP